MSPEYHEPLPIKSKHSVILEKAKYIYTGPSWAARAWEPEHNTELTNYAELLALPYYDVSRNGWQHDGIFKSLLDLDCRNKPIIYLWPGLSESRWIELAVDTHWKSKIMDFQIKDLNELNDLGNKILIIGSHSNIRVDGSYSNITFYQENIQDYINKQCNTTCDYLFDAEAAHANGVLRHKRPDPGLVDAVYECMETWRKWDELGYFYACHPTNKTVKGFIKKNKTSILSWLSSVD